MKQTLAYYAAYLHYDFVNYCNQRLEKIGLSQGQIFVILYIGNYPGCSPKELTRELRMDPGQAARTLARLSQEGFLIQEKSPNDRRLHILHLTKKGESAFALNHDLFTQWDAEIMKYFSVEERVLLKKLLSRLIS